MPGDIDIEIETNGTIIPKDLGLTRADFNISPKLVHSNNGTRNTDMKLEFLDFCRRNKAVLKYVVSTPEDFDEIDWCIKNWRVDNRNVFIMPEGVDRESVCDKLPWLFEACNERGYNLTTRLHVLAFGDMKGV